MKLLFSYNQEKIVKKGGGSKSACDLKLYHDGPNINYIGLFDIEYMCHGEKKQVVFEYFLHINQDNADITTSYKITTNSLTNDFLFRTKNKHRKNDFDMILDVIENGMIAGERKSKAWGVNYNRAIELIFNKIVKLLYPGIRSSPIKERDYKNKYDYNNLFDFLVDWHLDIKEIKAPDFVHARILNDYPKKKWLEKNDNKFIPAILDKYGIKSKYLIGALNRVGNKNIHISTLAYICKLFGDNYVDHIKKFDWASHCVITPPSGKVPPLKNESEKSFMIEVFNNWGKSMLHNDSAVEKIHKLLTIREVLGEKGFDLKFKAKDDEDFDNLYGLWSGIKQHLSKGYKLRYTLPESFIETIESDIVVDGNTFKPKVLVSEDDYKIEGYKMKNCMSKQFPHGAIYVYIALQWNRKRINLQYRKGKMIQSFGKANSPVIDIFEEPSGILNQRMLKFQTMEWKREKYDIIQRL